MAHRVIARSSSRTDRRCAIAAALALGMLLSAPVTPGYASGAQSAVGGQNAGQDDELPDVDPRWRWPVDGQRRVVEPFRAPAHEYGPGHRGIDIAAPVGSAARAPADGVVAFRGTVVDRPLLTIEHATGLVVTFEPLASDLTPGDVVAAGESIGTVATGGHTPPGLLHVGVRWHGDYLNPLPLFGELPRAVLLPCCS